MKTIDLTRTWFSEIRANPNREVHVVFSNEYIHMTWNLFQYGYRRFGIVWYSQNALAFYFGSGVFSISFRKVTK